MVAFLQGVLGLTTSQEGSDFAAQLLNAQRELAHRVLGATTAIGESVQKETEKAAGTAKKPTKR